MTGRHYLLHFEFLGGTVFLRARGGVSHLDVSHIDGRAWFIRVRAEETRELMRGVKEEQVLESMK